MEDSVAASAAKAAVIAAKAAVIVAKAAIIVAKAAVIVKDNVEDSVVASVKAVAHGGVPVITVILKKNSL